MPPEGLVRLIQCKTLPSTRERAACQPIDVAKGLKFYAPVVSTLVVFVMASCAQTPAANRENTTSAGPTAAVTPGGLGLTGSLIMSGQFAFTGGFTALAPIEVSGSVTPAPPETSCSQYAQGYPQDPQHGGGIGFDPPAAHIPGPPSLYLSVSLPTGYRGPGTYSSRTSTALSGTAAVGVGAAEGLSYYTFNSRDGATVLTVRPDGSGTVTYSGWQDSERRGGNQTGTITGSLTWTCP